MVHASRVSFSGASILVVASCFWLTLDAQQPPPQPAVAQAPTDHTRFVTRYCASCHNDRLKRGGLSLDAAVRDEVGHAPEVWEKVLRKVRARQMPPVGLPRPDETTYNAEVATLETALDRAASILRSARLPARR